MDRSLATLLRSLHASSRPQDAARLLPSATGLLSRLSNPLNISLLSSQVLNNDLLFLNPVSLNACRSIFSCFYTAALRFAEDEKSEKAQQTRSHLSRVEWTTAVIQGADDKSPRWRHLLLLGGVLLGFEGQGTNELPAALRNKIETALITATNLAILEKDEREPNNQLCTVFVLNTIFPLIADQHRNQLRCDVLLPEIVDAVYFSNEGLEHGYWLGTIDSDVRQVSRSQFHWDARSVSAARVQQIKSRPLIASLGPLSRLLAHSVECVHDSNLIAGVLSRLAEFSRNIALSWRQNKLSEIDPSEEGEFLDDETRRTIMPELLQLLRNTMFSIIISLRSIIGRVILDPQLSSDTRAPTIAIQTLHILRDVYFISHRFGQHSSSQYMFVNYTSIDILNQFPAQAESFLSATKPTEIGNVPVHPLDRLNDLFFLNAAEHFTLVLTPESCQDLLVNAALPYITTNGDRRLSELYEAAHSVLLAVFAAPQNGGISAHHVPFYIETLLQSFPRSLTPRQFRLAIRSLMQVSGPRSPVSASMPQLQEIVMDMLMSRLSHASEALLPPSDVTLVESAVPASEKSTLLLAMIENLNTFPVYLLEEWLTITAESLQRLDDELQRSECQKRFWEVLSAGDMDVERAALCVAWWTSRGGRELVLFGHEPPSHDLTMSGGLSLDSKM